MRTRSVKVTTPSDQNDDLFKDGALDSFALIDFVTLLEEHTGIKVPDKGVNPGNFQTLDAVERYIETHKG